MTILNVIRTFVQNEIGKAYAALDSRVTGLHKQLSKKLDKADYKNPDWDELDSSKSGYIKNKPFGYSAERGRKFVSINDYYFDGNDLTVLCWSEEPLLDCYPFMVDGKQYEFILYCSITDIDGEERSFEFYGTGAFKAGAERLGYFDVVECSPFNPFIGARIGGLNLLKRAVRDPDSYNNDAVFGLSNSFLEANQYASLNYFDVELYGKFAKYDGLSLTMDDIPSTLDHLALQDWLSQHSNADRTAVGFKSASFGESIAKGIYSMSGGYGSIANADSSMAVGYYATTNVNARAQVAVGRDNSVLSSCAFMVGNGERTSNGNVLTIRHSNAFAVAWDGTGYFAGRVFKNTPSEVSSLDKPYNPNTNDELLSRNEVLNLILQYTNPINGILNTQLYVRDLQYGSTNAPRITDITYSDDLICVYINDAELSTFRASHRYAIFRLIIPEENGTDAPQYWPRIYTTSQNNSEFYGMYNGKKVKVLSDKGHTPSTT